MFQKMMEEAVVKEVTEIVGEEHITVKEFDLVPYTLDALSYSFENGCSADVVVLPKSAFEVSKIVKLANKRRTPVSLWKWQLSHGQCYSAEEGNTHGFKEDE